VTKLGRGEGGGIIANSSEFVNNLMRKHLAHACSLGTAPSFGKKKKFPTYHNLCNYCPNPNSVIYR